MLFTSISKLEISMKLCRDFQSNMGCFKTGPPVFGIAGPGLVVLAGVCVSLTVNIAALAGSVTLCVMTCGMLCSDAILSLI